jgi:hypothetical protein
MKIYIPEINISDLDFTPLKDNVVSVEKKHFLWCSDRLLEIKNNKIYNVNIRGKNSSKHQVEDLEIIIDPSYNEPFSDKEVNEQIHFQIPPNHVEERVLIKKYQLINTANFFLITEEAIRNNELTINDFYFYMDTPLYQESYNYDNLFKLEKENIKKNMHTFLTRLKLCN